MHIKKLACVAVVLLGYCPLLADDVALVVDGRARVAIHVPSSVLDSQDRPTSGSAFPVAEAEAQRQRLRESVQDLALYLEKMSGAKVEILSGRVAQGKDSRLPVFIGDEARDRFGEVGKTAPYKQAFRVVVTPKAIGLYGESDLATSYAIYELLDRLGCRWYLPGPLGEVVPDRERVTLPAGDEKLAPCTIFRGGLGDAAFLRRNRVGGMVPHAQYGSVEGYITDEQRAENPEWRATVGGEPHPSRLRWSNPAVADAVARAILAKLGEHSVPTVSFFLGAGCDFDESAEDRALDSRDFDPVYNGPVVSDRLLVLANRVAERVAVSHPDTLLIASAYCTAVPAPRREEVHPNVVPLVVTASFDRAHPLSSDAPNNPAHRAAIEGWGRAARYAGVYAYAYHLAEPTAPYPMIARWSADLPFYFSNNCRFWNPECVANYESSLPGLYLGMRLAWDPGQNPEDVLSDLFEGFYGAAAEEMNAYWRFVDEAWDRSPESAGMHLGYLRRFPPEMLAEARARMNAAVSAAESPQERARVKLADDSLRLFELYMKMRRDFVAGRFDSLETDSARWLSSMQRLGEAHAAEFAFGGLGPGNFTALVQPAYREAAALARDRRILTRDPLRTWKWRADREAEGQAAGWWKADFDDTGWKTTDVGVETWSAMGLHNYFGDLWYRTTAEIPSPAAGKKIYLWLSGTDGAAKVFVNGRHIPLDDAQGQKHEKFSGFCQPVSFEITDAIGPGANRIAILCTRTALNEIGSGGLLGPAVVYAEK